MPLLNECLVPRRTGVSLNKKLASEQFHLTTGSGRQKLQHLHHEIGYVYPGAIIPYTVKGLPFGIRRDSQGGQPDSPQRPTNVPGVHEKAADAD